jgi:hypothetical protein
MKERTFLAVLVFLGLGAMPVPTRGAQDVSALIKRQSQHFSDASASGDATVLARLLDKDVVFVNESGEIGSKQDIVGSAWKRHAQSEPVAAISN